jgi:hypothetical protein
MMLNNNQIHPLNTSVGITYVDNSPLLSLKSPSEEVLIIERDGTFKYRLNGEMKILEDEKELPILFMMAISSLTGFTFLDKEDLIQTVIKNYRNGKIDDIFRK